MIQIQHLTKRFAAAGATVVALNDINLEIQDGDIYGIIGMSGAGKSTLVRCINMLERPDEGKVIVNGREMMQLSPAELRDARREITMIFQQFNLLMQRSCLKNICFPMELAGVPKEKATARARELLELVGLPDKADAYPAQLSGGDIVLDETTLTLRNVHTGESVRLGDKEFRILEYFLRNRGRILTRDQLVQRVWGYDSDAEYNKIEVYLTFTRKKLAFIGSDAKIKAVRGVGYELQLPDEVRS